jgi:hypothetical protein
MGMRKKRYKRKKLVKWDEEMSNLILGKKKQAYLKFLQIRPPETRTEYMRRRAVVKRETRKVNRNSWDYYISNIEDDVHGRQDRAYKIFKELQKTEEDKIQLNPIVEKQWIRYYIQP